MEPEVTYQIQYKHVREKIWKISSMWDTPEWAKRRCAELRAEGSMHYEFRPVKVTVEVLPE